MHDPFSSGWDPSWLALLACPGCAGPLQHASARELLCPGCSRAYPIVSQVPALLLEPTAAESRTQKLYGDLWGSDRKEATESRYRGAAASHIDLLRLASGHDPVQGRTGVDAGCGNGRGVLNLARRRPDVRFIGLDLSPGIRSTAQQAGDAPNLRFVQANLLAPPLAGRSLDFAYSFGVLHHTRDPRSAFLALAARLRPGGRVTLFVYKDFSDLPWKRLLLKPVTLARGVSTRLPAPLLRFLAWCASPAVFLLLTLPARFLRAVGQDRLARHVPYGTFPGLRGIAASLEDRFGAPYEHRFRVSDLEEWGRAARLRETRVADCLPWGFSGLVLSGLAPE